MMRDRARSILGGMSKAAKDYVIGGKDRVMSGSKDVSRRLRRVWDRFMVFEKYSRNKCDNSVGAGIPRPGP
jgi:hypothetical protein